MAGMKREDDLALIGQELALLRIQEEEMVDFILWIHKEEILFYEYIYFMHIFEANSWCCNVLHFDKGFLYIVIVIKLETLLIVSVLLLVVQNSIPDTKALLWH